MVRVKWFGHAAFLVDVGGKKFLVDPWITNPKSPVKNVREVAGNVDYIIVTHDHGDHLGDTLELMRANKSIKLIAIYEIADYVGRELGDQERVIGANIGGPIDLGNGYYVILTNALHSSSRGHATGAVFGREGELVYHAGDTGLTYDMKLIGELYKPLVAILPIGGHFTMGPREAAKAVELIRPKYAIPMHYETFPVIKGRPEEFKEYVSKLAPEVKVVILRPGEEVELK